MAPMKNIGTPALLNKCIGRCKYLFMKSISIKSD